MTLSFTQTINGKPNYFIEKIWACLTGNKLSNYFILGQYSGDYWNKYGVNWDGFEKFNATPKIHTIREDKSNRWRAGMKIHPVINNRTANRFQFAPVIKCTGTQKILISYWSGQPEVTVDNNLIYYWDAEIENGHMEMLKLAQADGFDTVRDFFNYFDKDFAGVLIHWTNKRY